jgi:hypothetical protein
MDTRSSRSTDANLVARLLAGLREWAGVVALFLVLTGGVAYAANTVFSSDIVNGEVKSVDIGDNQVQGVDVKDKSLSGADLGVRVRSAKQVDDGSGGATCGQGAEFDECITVNFTVPRPQRLLLVGSGEWTGSSFTPGGTNSGECRFSVGALAQVGLRKFGEVGSSPSGPFNFAMNSVTGVLDQGFYEIGIDCRRTSDASSGITVRNTELSVAALGDG